MVFITAIESKLSQMKTTSACPHQISKPMDVDLHPSFFFFCQDEVGKGILSSLPFSEVFLMTPFPPCPSAWLNFFHPKSLLSPVPATLHLLPVLFFRSTALKTLNFSYLLVFILMPKSLALSSSFLCAHNFSPRSLGSICSPWYYAPLGCKQPSQPLGYHPWGPSVSVP